ncbi:MULTISPECIES: AAA family ATPase [Lachnospiraceae]|uniref:AAA family ATPase n=1 Tax=Lachnospiraceae TaxID=186803 RepID=UPI00210C2AC9|nr:AAA family ATPase [Blautia producta]
MNSLFDPWTWNRKHIAPFDSYSKPLLARTDVSSQYSNGPVLKATVHPLVMRAVHAYMNLENGTLVAGQAHTGAIGSQGNTMTIAEYPSVSGELHVVVYNRNTGTLKAGIYSDPIIPTDKPVSYKYNENGNSGTAVFFALIPTLLGNPEFNQAYQDYKAQAAAGFPDDNKTSKAAALLSDNVYRRVQNMSNGWPEGLPVKVNAGGVITPIRSLDVKKGTYLPTNVLFGNFEILKNDNCTKKAVSTISLSSFVGKYQLDENRQLTPEEELTVPELPSWYVVPPEIQMICEHAKQTTGTAHAMRNFMMRGPAGTGKTEGARAIAAAMHLPYRFITCSANTEVFDLIGQILPSTKDTSQISEEKEYPSLTDIQMDPASAYYMLTGQYEESIDEFTVYKALLETVKQDTMNNSENASPAREFEYVDTPLVDAIRNGYLLEIQEPSCIANPAVLVGLNGLLDQCKSITLPTGETVLRHPDTVIVITTNVDYAGCRGMNQSIISRMNLVIDLDAPDIDTLVQRVQGITGCKDTSAIRSMAEIVHSIHEYCHDASITDGCCGVRELIAWVQSYMICNSISEAAKYTVLSCASSDASCREEIKASCLDTVLAA